MRDVKNVVSKDEQIGRRIAKRALREMLTRADTRCDVQEHGIREVGNYKQALYVRKHVNVYCRQLAATLRGMK